MTEEIGPWRREAGLAAWNRYAAVNDEFVSIHMDDAAAQAAGMPAAFGMGNLTISWLHNLLRAWAGDAGVIDRFAVRFRRPAFRGEVVCTGSVVARGERDGVVTAAVSLVVRDASGQLLADGSADVRWDAGGHAPAGSTSRMSDSVI